MITPQRKRQLTHANPKMTQVLELSDRFIGAVLTTLQEIMVTTLEMNGKIEVLSRDTEPMKEKQVNVLELKNTINSKKCMGWAQ